MNTFSSKRAAAVDTIDFKAIGYKTRSFKISSYDAKLRDITMEKEQSFQTMRLNSEMMKGTWYYIRYDQDGCESYIDFPEYKALSYRITPQQNNQFIFTDTEPHNGVIVDDQYLILERIFNNYYSGQRDVQYIIAWQAHPTPLLAGSVFAGVGVFGEYNLWTGSELCAGTYKFLMVRDFSFFETGHSSSNGGYNATCVRATELRRRYNECMKDNHYAECYEYDRDAKLVEEQCRLAK